MKELDPYDPTCPTRALLERIADKWTVLIVGCLRGGTRRHGEIKRALGKISQKVLSSVLRQMERDGLIVRKVYPTVPPKVEYTLTTEGLTLVDLVDRVHAWAVAHTDVVLRAQRRFDEVSGAAIDKNADASLPSGRKTNRP